MCFTWRFLGLVTASSQALRVHCYIISFGIATIIVQRKELLADLLSYELIPLL
jgi:hypothetical protein